MSLLSLVVEASKEQKVSVCAWSANALRLSDDLPRDLKPAPSPYEVGISDILHAAVPLHHGISNNIRLL